ncbi:MAG: CidA/LrgA family protein [Pseudogulbenkiania sp.]|nr:CidA/LrgA family protein [Pseudogulbenkiania sp.]
MIETLIWLLGYQLAGELICRSLALPLPGAVLGMLLLFLTLCAKKGIPASLNTHVPQLLGHFSLLFIPACAGVIVYWPLLTAHCWALLATLAGATLITLLVPAVLLKVLLARRHGRRPA